MADITIPDTEDGFGSSVPGVPGNTAAVRKGKDEGECGVSCRPKEGGTVVRGERNTHHWHVKV